MPIEIKTGDLFAEDSEALVNPVNCVGVMGKGLAAEFKKRWPQNFRAYKDWCMSGEAQRGRLLFWPTGEDENPRAIINFPTKRHWRNPSREEDIRSGLAALAENLPAWNIHSVAMPALGCGLGGLDWDVVREMIHEHLQSLEDTRIVVFAPH